MYTEEGRGIQARLWQETLNELEPFGVSVALQALQG